MSKMETKKFINNMHEGIVYLHLNSSYCCYSFRLQNTEFVSKKLIEYLTSTSLYAHEDIDEIPWVMKTHFGTEKLAFTILFLYSSIIYNCYYTMRIGPRMKHTLWNFASFEDIKV